jgi:hypothetical protein
LLHLHASEPEIRTLAQIKGPLKASSTKVGGTSRFYVDPESDEACIRIIAQRPLIKGVLSAIGDTDVTGDSKKSRSRTTGDHENQRTVKIKYVYQHQKIQDKRQC